MCMCEEGAMSWRCSAGGACFQRAWAQCPWGIGTVCSMGPVPVSDPLEQEDECSGVDRPAPGRTRPDRASASEGGWGP